MSLPLFLRTVRYLRPIQFFGRLWFRFYSPAVEDYPNPPLRPTVLSWVKNAQHMPSMVAADRFILLNEEGELTGPDSWNNPVRDKLWLYNLHYFDDLNAVGAEARTAWHRALIDRWVAENPPTSSNGWEPYPLSLRIVNWVKWALQGNVLEDGWRQSLAMQARFLRKRLEVHLLGNHLFANAKALVFAGLYFSGEEADEWLEKGLSILAIELKEQVLKDGGHFELSPMYHSIILEDLLDLINICNTYGVFTVRPIRLKDWRTAVHRMQEWLKVMCHPDGDVSFFNDTTLGIAPTAQALEVYARRLGLDSATTNHTKHVTRLFESGYLRLESDNAVAILDVGRIGPDYLPGHAHADTLSFELSLFGERVVVNSGISRYGSSKERVRQRGTSTHSTVEVDGENSSEVWGGFRVARRARPFGLEVLKEADEISVSCSHDGYMRLTGKPIHQRKWDVTSGQMIVTDQIKGGFSHAIARYYLYPDVSIEFEQDENHGILKLKNGKSVKFYVEGGRVTIKDTLWHPGFGLYVDNNLIEIRFEGEEVITRFEY